MKNIFYVMATAALVLSSCAQEEINAPVSKNVLTATIANDASRITIGDVADGKAKLSWKAEDAFTAFKMDKSTADYVLDSQEGASTGTFSSPQEIGKLTYAMYPALSAEELKNLTLKHDDQSNSDILGYALTKEYADNSKKYYVMPDKLPMYGVIEGNQVTFKHVFAVLKIVLTNPNKDCKKISIKSSSSKNPVNGSYEVDLSKLATEENPLKITGTGTLVSHPKTKDNIYYIPLFPLKYTSLTIQSNNRAEGKKAYDVVDLFKLTDKTVEAGKIYTVEFDAQGK